MTLPDAKSLAVAPRPLNYGFTRRVGCVSIEEYPDGVIIVASVPRARWWLAFGFHAIVVLLLLAAALVPAEVWTGVGISAAAGDPQNRFELGVIGFLLIAVLVVEFFTPRGPTTLVARAGRFGYSAPRMFGTLALACALDEIDAIEFDASKSDPPDSIRITRSRIGYRHLFVGLNATETEAVAVELLHVWRCAVARDRA